MKLKGPLRVKRVNMCGGRQGVLTGGLRKVFLVWANNRDTDSEADKGSPKSINA